MWKGNESYTVRNFLFNIGFWTVFCFILSSCCSTQEREIYELKQELKDCPRVACKVCQEQKDAEAKKELERQQQREAQRRIEETRRREESERKEKEQQIEEVCQILYLVYKQCYGEGIKCRGNLDCCAEAGAKLYMGLMNKFSGLNDSGKILALTCAMACQSAGSNQGLPSYDQFKRDVCNKAFAD